MNNDLKNGDIYTFRIKRNKVRNIKKTYLFQEDCWKLIKAFMFKPAECCGKNCDETCGLKWVLGFNYNHINLCDRIKRLPFCDYHITDYTTDQCDGCDLTFPCAKLTFVLDADSVVCKSCIIKQDKRIHYTQLIYERDCLVKPNCNCNLSYDLRCLCYPKKDYRKKNPYTKDFIFNITKEYDFRKCPMRFTSATEFILNDYDKYKLIENATTVKDKIKIFKKIIIKDFKLTSKDFEIILKYYLQEEDNIIQPILRDQDVEDSE